MYGFHILHLLWYNAGMSLLCILPYSLDISRCSCSLPLNSAHTQYLHDGTHAHWIESDRYEDNEIIIRWRVICIQYSFLAKFIFELSCVYMPLWRTCNISTVQHAHRVDVWYSEIKPALVLFSPSNCSRGIITKYSLKLSVYIHGKFSRKYRMSWVQPFSWL